MEKDIDVKMYRKNLKGNGNWYLDCPDLNIKEYDLGTPDTKLASLKADSYIEYMQKNESIKKKWPLYYHTELSKRIYINPNFIENDPITKNEISKGILKKIH